MADESDSVVIEVTPDDVKFIRKLRDLEDAASKSGKAAGEGLSKGFEAGLGSIALVLAAVAAAVKVATSGINFFSGAIKEAAAGDAELNRLNTSLKLAGTYSEEASKKFQDLADRIEQTTKIDGDKVLGLAAIARNFTKSNEQALKLTEAAIELGAATGKGPDAAMQSLAMTLSGVSGRVGKLVPEIGMLTEAQLRAGGAIDAVMARFKGAAAGETRTFEGAIAQLSNTWNNFVKTIGQYVTRSPAIIVAIKEIASVIGGFGSSVNNALGRTDFFKDIIINFSVVAQAGIATASSIGNSFELAYLRSAQAWAAFKVLTTAGLSEFQNAELMRINKQIDEVKARWGQDPAMIVFLDNLILKLRQTGGVLDETAGSNGGGVAGLNAGFNALGTTINNVVGVVAQKLQAELQRIQQFTAQVNQNLASGLAGGISTTIQKTVTALAKGQNAFQAFAQGAISAIGDIAIQMGTFFLATGLGMAALLSNPVTAAGALIVQGVALIAIGSLIKALSGGGGEKGANVSAGQPGSGVPGGGAVTTPDQTTDLAGGTEKNSRLTVNIQGNVFDTKETGLRIVEIMQEAFDTTGAKVVTA